MERYDRLESKIDKVNDDVTEVKVDMAEVKNMVKNTNEIMSEHIAGDNKIISQLAPILNELGDMVQDHTYNKMKKEERFDKLKLWSIRLSLFGTVVGIGAGIAKILELF